MFRTAPKLELVRRYPLPGSPYGIPLDPVRRRLCVTLTAANELVELPAHGRPHALRRFATVRQPNGVAIDSSTGRVFVTGRPTACCRRSTAADNLASTQLRYR